MDQAPEKPHSYFAKLLQPSSALLPAVVGSLLCWLALPPIAWHGLAWVGPIPWLLLILQEKLPGRRPYRALWLGGFVFWLLTVHWIRLPHPLNYLAWIVLASYLGIYLPVFVGLSRVAVHRWRLPFSLAVPTVWVGLDWLRGYLFTGFAMGSLAHSQASQTRLIQIADRVGEYGVTFLILLVAAALAQFLFSFSTQKDRSYRYRTLVVAAVAVVGAYAYGSFTVTQLQTASSQDQSNQFLRVALIQGNTLADWKRDAERQQQIMDEHIRLSREAVKTSRESDGRDVDLVIWPETAFRQHLFTVAPGYTPPPERVSASELLAGQNYLALLAKDLRAALLVGIDRVEVFPDAEQQLDYHEYNSSVLVDKLGEVIGTYDKMHRVPFGEYIPFADWFPVLNRLSALTGDIDAGQKPAGLWLDEMLLAPNICYESAVPHLIRRHVNQIESVTSNRPDVLVNLTNDAWYWGSSELDMHLACGVFRAVEMRLPLVIAANGGLSAHIDRTGIVQQVTERQQPMFLLVDLAKQPVHSTSYASWGDWLAIACMLCCTVLALSAWTHRKSERRSPTS